MTASISSPHGAGSSRMRKRSNKYLGESSGEALNWNSRLSSSLSSSWLLESLAISYLQHYPTSSNSLWLVSTTFAASVASAGISYPAEQARVQWEQKALSQWNNYFATEATARQRPNRILTPFFRLWLNQMTSTALQQSFFFTTTNTTTTTTAMTRKSNNASTISQRQQRLLHTLEMEIMAGTIAGVAQVSLLLPLELSQSYYRHVYELHQSKSWRHWLDSHLYRGGIFDPKERQQRVLRGIGLLVAREIAFNVTFFPMFELFKRAQLGGLPWQLNEGIPPSMYYEYYNPTTKPSFGVLLASGVGAGMISSLIVTPIDILQVYFRNSRTVWHWWKGERIKAPPLKLLGRGLLPLQACVFGPSFGLVAAIYEWVK